MPINQPREPKYPDLSQHLPEAIKEYLEEFTSGEDDGWTTEQLFTIQRFLEDLDLYCQHYGE